MWYNIIIKGVDDMENILRELENVKWYLETIEESKEDELFSSEFWWGEVMHGLDNVLELINNYKTKE